MPAFPVTISDCATLEANTVENPSWLGPVLDADQVYRYPGVPTSGSWSGVYRDLMRFRSSADIDATRAVLRQRIWQSTSMIAGGYDRETVDGDHTVYEVDMPYWLTTSRCWLYRSTVERTGTLLIVHGGHDNHGPEHSALIPIRTEALAAGHDVLVVSMPGQSVNSTPGPYPYLDVFNGVVASHQNLPLWNRRFLNQTWVNAQFGVPPESVFHVFYAPVHRMINAIGGNYDRIAMTGLSGGASTTIRCAALDTRIQAAYAVAGGGCVPRFAYYQTALDFGDNEDQDKTWFGPGANSVPGDDGTGANEEETLVMMVSGNRRGLIVVNDNDPVAFGSVDISLYKEAAEYEARAIGDGRLIVHLDNNNTHSWSAATRAYILADLERLMPSNTTAAAVREAMLTAVEGITPAIESSTPFRRFREQAPGDFRDWAEKHPGQCLRRVSIRSVGSQRSALVSSTLSEETSDTFEVVVAYQASNRFGSAAELDDVIEADQKQIHRVIGPPGYASFSAPATVIHQDNWERENAPGVVFAVIRYRVDWFRGLT